MNAAHVMSLHSVPFSRALNSRSIRSPLAAGSLLLVLLFALLGSAGCSTTSGTSAKPATGDRPLSPERWVRTELYFGAVEIGLWDDFLAKEVTPRFPSGLTVFEARGQWRNKSGEIHRIPTRVLVILHPGSPETNRALEEIRSRFRDQFRHESVLRADSPASVAF
jgi:hypothetical protein